MKPLMFLILAAAGQAQTLLPEPYTCDLMVITSSRAVPYDTEVSVMMASAARLRDSVGAEVRVRVFDHMNTSDLDSYQRNLEAECPSWTVPVVPYGPEVQRTLIRHRKSNLITILVAVADRKTGLFYGTQFKEALDPEWNWIQVQAMNPKFQEGRYAAGITAGIDAVRDKILASRKFQWPWYSWPLLIGFLGSVIIFLWVLSIRRAAREDRDLRQSISRADSRRYERINLNRKYGASLLPTDKVPVQPWQRTGTPDIAPSLLMSSQEPMRYDQEPPVTYDPPATYDPPSVPDTTPDCGGGGGTEW